MTARNNEAIMTPTWTRLLDGLGRRETKTPETKAGGHASPWLTVAEAAAYVGFCDKTIRRACQLGTLKCARVGRRIRIRREWLDAWVIAHSE